VKILKVLGVLLLSLVALFVLTSVFSYTTTKYECSGKFAKDGKEEVGKVFIKINKYAWFTKLWADADASMNSEIPNELVNYYSNVSIVGDQYQIYDSKLVGNFSNLSKILALKTVKGFFDGKCVQID